MSIKLAITIGATWLVACVVADVPNLWDMAKHKGLNKFIEIGVQHNMQDLLSGPERRTLFASNDLAFQRLSPEVSKILREDPTMWKTILEHHVVKDDVSEEQFQTDKILVTIRDDRPLRLNQYGNPTEPKSARYWTVNGVNISSTDIRASNGILHIIEDILYPVASGDVLDTLKSKFQSESKHFYEGIVNAHLQEDLKKDSISVFVPSQPGPENKSKNVTVGQDLLKYVVSGTYFTIGLQPLPMTLESQAGIPLEVKMNHVGDYVVNNVRIIRADHPTTNGVLHFLEDDFDDWTN